MDMKEHAPQNKKWDYVRKGVPFILEIGNKEVESGNVCVTKRLSSEKQNMSLTEFAAKVEKILIEHDEILRKRNSDFCNSRIVQVSSYNELSDFFRSGNIGFVKAKWARTNKNLELLDKLAVSIRCIPSTQSGTNGKCILTGAETTTDTIFAKSY